MPYTGNPATNPIDEVRLHVGDIWSDMEMLADSDYQYFLDKYEGNIRRATLDAARSILFKLARLSRERTGDIEVYGAEWFKNYQAALTEVLRNPELALSIAMPYAGGISKSDMAQNDANCDNVVRDVYIGFTEGVKLYDQKNPRDSYTTDAFGV